MNNTLRENIDWVGVVDWNVRDFHSYDTHRGATYNAYLVRDEKTALIDTVKAPFVDQLLKNLAERTPLEKIDYVVCNHAEPDHSSGFPTVMRTLPHAKVICNAKCRETLSAYYDTSEWTFEEIGDGETLSLGNRTLQFINTPMVHWPESMFTYVPEEKILFSMDGFGQHLATSNRFDDEVSLCDVMDEAKTYYANIVVPYSRQVLKVLEKAAGLPIEMIAPSHGVIWRSYVSEILGEYRDWASGRLESKVVVLYDTMWGSTQKMAEAIYEGAGEIEGIDVEMVHARRSTLTRIATVMLDAAGVALGSSTLNTLMMPSMAGALNYLQGLRTNAKVAMSFGSYGWGRGAVEGLEPWVDEVGWERVVDSIKHKYVPTAETLAACREAGRTLGQKTVERAAETA